jgi:hypothetical protein
MLTGRHFMLKYPALAVDDQLVVFTLPVGANLTVTSDKASESRVIDVIWNDRKFAMFGSDLTERGEENPGTERSEQAPLDSREIRQRLEDDFDTAQQRRMDASKKFAEVMGEIPSGTPHPDGTDHIRMASREYSASREAAIAAMKALSDYMTRGIIPPGLDPKRCKETDRNPS